MPRLLQFSKRGFVVWILVAILAALSQLPADLVISGTATLPDWELRPLWPFSDWSCVFPILRWGDPTPTIIFVAGMFAMPRWPHRLQLVALTTLTALAAYFFARGALG